jgi:hypothetical protein
VTAYPLIRICSPSEARGAFMYCHETEAKLSQPFGHYVFEPVFEQKSISPACRERERERERQRERERERERERGMDRTTDGGSERDR